MVFDCKSWYGWNPKNYNHGLQENTGILQKTFHGRMPNLDAHLFSVYSFKDRVEILALWGAGFEFEYFENYFELVSYWLTWKGSD